jgi:hypothetical protein
VRLASTLVILMLVISPAAQAEPVHLSCNGAQRSQGHWVTGVVESVSIDLEAGTISLEGRGEVPILGFGKVDLGDLLAVQQPGLEAGVNRVTGEIMISDSKYGHYFTGTCKAVKRLF